MGIAVLRVSGVRRSMFASRIESDHDDGLNGPDSNCPSMETNNGAMAEEYS